MQLPNTRIRKDSYGAIKKRLVKILVPSLGIVLISSINGYAQEASSDLTTLSHENEAQTNVAAAIQNSWNQVTSFDPFTEIEANFVMDVNDLVQTSFDLQGSSRSDGSGLGLTEEQVNAALQDYADEEVATQATGAIETANGQYTNLAQRQQQLHMGMTGLSSRGLSVNLNGNMLPENPAARGGAASSDPEYRGPWGVFLNGTYSKGDKDTTSRENGFDVDSYGLTGGVDYQITDALFAGLAFGYSLADADITNNAGHLKTYSKSVSTYTSYNIEHFYVDGLFSYARNDYHSQRNIEYSTINTSPASDAEGNLFAYGLTAGYRQNYGAWTVSGFAGTRYINADVGAFDEKGGASPELNLRVDSQDFESLKTILGGRVSFASSQSFGVFVPTFRAEWVHEFQNDSRTVNAVFINDPFSTPFAVPTDNPDRDYFKVGGGISFVVKNGIQGFVDYEATLGLDDISNHVVTVGGRYEF